MFAKDRDTREPVPHLIRRRGVLMSVQVEASMGPERSARNLTFAEEVIRPEAAPALLRHFFFEDRAKLIEARVRTRVATETRHDTGPVTQGLDSSAENTDVHKALVLAEREQLCAITTPRYVTRSRHYDLNYVISMQRVRANLIRGRFHTTPLFSAMLLVHGDTFCTYVCRSYKRTRYRQITHVRECNVFVLLVVQMGHGLG